MTLNAYNTFTEEEKKIQRLFGKWLTTKILNRYGTLISFSDFDQELKITILHSSAGMREHKCSCSFMYERVRSCSSVFALYVFVFFHPCSSEVLSQNHIDFYNRIYRRYRFSQLFTVT